MPKTKFAIPKGSLERATFDLLERVWYKVHGRERTYRPTVDDPSIELKMLRPQEIPIFVSEGLHDLGITGQDWIRETKADVDILLKLGYGKIKLVVALPRALGINSLSDLFKEFWRTQRKVRVSTEYPSISAEYIKSNPFYRRSFGGQDPYVITPWWRTGTNGLVSRRPSGPNRKPLVR